MQLCVISAKPKYVADHVVVENPVDTVSTCIFQETASTVHPLSNVIQTVCERRARLRCK